MRWMPLWLHFFEPLWTKSAAKLRITVHSAKLFNGFLRIKMEECTVSTYMYCLL